MAPLVSSPKFPPSSFDSPGSHMPEKAVYLLVFDGFADWEPAHAVAELRRTGQYRVESVGLTAAPVESMGGIRVLPSTDRDGGRPGRRGGVHPSRRRSVGESACRTGDRTVAEPSGRRARSDRGDLRRHGGDRTDWACCEVAGTRATGWTISGRTFPATPTRRTTSMCRRCAIAGSSPPAAWATSSSRASSSRN